MLQLPGTPFPGTEKLPTFTAKMSCSTSVIPNVTLAFGNEYTSSALPFAGSVGIMMLFAKCKRALRYAMDILLLVLFYIAQDHSA